MVTSPQVVGCDAPATLAQGQPETETMIAPAAVGVTVHPSIVADPGGAADKCRFLGARMPAGGL